MNYLFHCLSFGPITNSDMIVTHDINLTTVHDWAIFLKRRKKTPCCFFSKIVNFCIPISGSTWWLCHACKVPSVLNCLEGNIRYDLHTMAQVLWCRILHRVGRHSSIWKHVNSNWGCVTMVLASWSTLRETPFRLPFKGACSLPRHVSPCRCSV